jgi:hypothetical protein
MLPRYACLQPLACLLGVAPPPPKNHKTSNDPVSGERLKRVDGAHSVGAVGGVLGPSRPPLLVPRQGPRRDACKPALDAPGIPPRPHLPGGACMAGWPREEERRGSQRRWREERVRAVAGQDDAGGRKRGRI